jgi:LacI family transcriptional regulator
MIRNKPLYRLAVVMDIEHPYFRQMAFGIRKYVQEHPECGLASLKGRPFLNYDHLKHVEYDGVITLVTSRNQTFRPGCPVVNISNNAPPPHVPAVLTDDVAVGRMAAEHLLEMGYTQFACPAKTTGYTVFTQERVRGFQERIQEAKGIWAGIHSYEALQLPDETHENAYRRFLSGLPRCTGVFAPEDDIALHMISLMPELGLSCPGDIGILGVNNDELHSQLLGVALSSIELDGESIGYQAAEMLVAILRGQSTEPTRVKLPPKRVHARATTDLRRVIDPQLTPVIDFIDNNLEQRISITRLSALSGLKRRAFEGRFRKVFGMSPYALIIHKRMELAKDLLTGTNQQISLVSRACGYVNLSEFTKSFHERVGMSPKAFRQRYGHMTP